MLYGACPACSIGSYCEGANTVDSRCPAGFYCPTVITKLACPDGASYSGSISITECQCKPGRILVDDIGNCIDGTPAIWEPSTTWSWLLPADDVLDMSGGNGYHPFFHPVPTPDPLFQGLSSTKVDDYPISRRGHIMIEYPMAPSYPIYVFGGYGPGDAALDGVGKMNDCM